MTSFEEIETTQKWLHKEILDWQKTRQLLMAAQSYLLAQEAQIENSSTGLALENLSTFTEIQAPLGPEMGEKLEHSSAQVVCYVRRQQVTAAMVYRQVIGRTETNFTIIETDDPIRESELLKTRGVIPIVINSAIDPELKEMMFQNPHFGQLLTDRFPVTNLENPTLGPVLHCVGVTAHGIEVLSHAETLGILGQENDLEKKRSSRIKNSLGDIITPADVHKILQSEKVKKVRIHTLGPPGTNISQAAVLYVQRLGINNKAEIIIHGPGVTPMEYSQIAADETQKILSTGSLPEVLNLHVECAVYYNMGKLYQQRVGESVFIDEQDMSLDTMQLACRGAAPELAQKLQRGEKIKLATHSSPQSLALPWIKTGQVEVIKASSNSEAAMRVAAGEADVCITTASAVELSVGAVQTLHEFGSPNMIFTIGSPLSHDQLKQYLVEGR